MQTKICIDDNSYCSVIQFSLQLLRPQLYLLLIFRAPPLRRSTHSERLTLQPAQADRLTCGFQSGIHPGSSLLSCADTDQRQEAVPLSLTFIGVCAPIVVRMDPPPLVCRYEESQSSRSCSIKVRRLDFSVFSDED